MFRVILSPFGRKPGPMVACLAGMIFAGTAAPHANAAEPVGKSVRIKNLVTGSLGERVLKPRDVVFADESITAQSDSHGELLLNDNSKVLVGENSSISLDNFVTGDRGFSSGTVKVAKGAFRFITGNSAKGSFSVETPVSTIGVRGTLFDVYVSAGGITRVVLYRGEVEVCSAQNCIVTNRACDIVEVENEEARELPYLRGGSREQERADYTLSELQGRFRPGWRAPVFGCDVRAFFDPNHPGKSEQPLKPIVPPLKDGNDSIGLPPSAAPCASLQAPALRDGLELAVAYTPGTTPTSPCT